VLGNLLEEADLKVFLADLDRLSRSCRVQKQVVLAIDAGHTLDEYSCLASASPIATGDALRNSARRYQSVSVPYEEWLQRGAWRADT
jgi:hypothetical protein